MILSRTLILGLGASFLSVAQALTHGKRQQAPLIPNLPSNCASTCTVLDSIQQTTDALTLCNQDTRNGIQRCMDCIIIAGGEAISSELLGNSQLAVNAYVQACSQAALEIEPIVVENPSTGDRSPVPPISNDSEDSGDQGGNDNGSDALRDAFLSRSNIALALVSAFVTLVSL